MDDIGGVALSSVVPRVTAALREMTMRYFGFAALVVGPGIRSGMPILYDDPKEVGADRIANAVGAFDLYGGPTVVVDFGTATTFDAISAKGEYMGGAIVPGIEISLDALFEKAAGLRRVELSRRATSSEDRPRNRSSPARSTASPRRSTASSSDSKSSWERATSSRRVDSRT